MDGLYFFFFAKVPISKLLFFHDAREENDLIHNLCEVSLEENRNVL